MRFALTLAKENAIKYVGQDMCERQQMVEVAFKGFGHGCLETCGVWAGAPTNKKQQRVSHVSFACMVEMSGDATQAKSLTREESYYQEAH